MFEHYLISFKKNCSQNKDMNKDFYEIGLKFLDQNEFSLACKFFTICISNNINVSQAYLHRAIASFKLWKTEDALIDVTKSIELEESIDAYMNRAIIRLGANELDLALVDYNLVLKIDSESIEALINILPILVVKKRFVEAYEKLQKVKSMIQFTDELCLDEININFGLKNYSESIQGLFYLLRKSPTNVGYLNYVGFCFLMLNDKNEAVKYFEKSLKYNPDYPYPKNNLGYIEYLNLNYEKAKKLIYKSLELDPSNSFAYKNLGLIELKLGNNNIAIEHFEFALELGFRELWGEEVDELLKNLKNI